MAKRSGMAYDAPTAYDRLIAPRFAPIAEALVEAARLSPGEDVLELGAGTGLVTRLAAERLGGRGSLCATDLSAGMLDVARRSLRNGNATFVLADYHSPIPFLARSFDVVLSGLTYVQNSAASLAEIARVLRPNGRLALAMWGTSYGEVRLMSAARRALGQPPFPPAAPGRALSRLARAGFRRVHRRDLELRPRFASVADYIAYRRGFGIPVGQTSAQHGRYLDALRRGAEREVADDGSLTLHWNVVVITARRAR